MWGYSYVYQGGGIHGSEMTITYPNGFIVKFATPQGNVLRSQPGTRDRFIFTGTNTGTILLGDGSKVGLAFETMYVSGYGTECHAIRAVWTEDPHGLRTELENDSLYRLTRVTDPSGRWLSVSYNGNTHEVSRVDSSDGQWVTYTWANNNYFEGRILEANYSDGSSASYTYCNYVQSIPIALPNGDEGYNLYNWFRLETAHDVRAMAVMCDIRYVYADYDAMLGQVYSENDLSTGALISRHDGGPGSYDSNWNYTATEHLANGAYRQFTLHKVNPGFSYYFSPELIVNRTDFLGHSESFEYDTNWFLKKKTDARGHVTSWSNEPVLGHPTVITLPDSKTRIFQYSDSSNPNFVYKYTDERNNTTTYDRFANNIIRTITYPDGSYESWGGLTAFNQPTTYRGRNGSETLYEYDARGLLQKQWQPSFDGPHSYTSYSYYPQGHVWADRVQTITDALGHTTTMEYDLQFVNGSQSTAPCSGRGLVTKVTYADGKYRTFGYDPAGNRVWEENELRQRTSHTYDAYHRITSTTDPLNRTTLTSYGDNPSEAMNHTDNRPRRVQTPMGKTTIYSYDANRRTSDKIEGDGSAERKAWHYGYDECGNLTVMREQVGGVAGAETWRDTTFDFDERDRKITEYAPLGRTTDWQYDGAGNISWIHYADGSFVSKAYDNLNRLHTITDEMSRTTVYNYYPSGKVESIVDPKGFVYRYEYDASLRRTFMWFTNADNTGFDYEQSIYDEAANLVQFRNRSGQWKTIGYDVRDREISTSWTNGAALPTSTAYDDAGRVTQRVNANSTIDYSYNAAGQVIEEKQTIAGLGTKWVGSEYDSDGNRKRLFSNQ
jgi:YD repeat-containing protein